MEDKVTHTEMATLPKIWAVDFDGCLVTDKYPEIGTPDMELVNYLIDLRKTGTRLILWTCRDNDTKHKHLDRAVEFCTKLGLEFDAVNKNIKETIGMFRNDTRKVYANVYLDDKAMFQKCRVE